MRPFRRKPAPIAYHFFVSHIPEGCRALIQVSPKTSADACARLREELDRRHPGNNYLIVACDRILVDWNHRDPRFAINTTEDA